MRDMCVLTVVRNEKIFLPLWYEYYSRAFENCDIYIDDNMSDDGSCELLPPDVNVTKCTSIRPGQAYDIAPHITARVTQLLGSYKCVMFAEVDDFYVADPAHHASLKEYVEKFLVSKDQFRAVNGHDVQHIIDTEPALDLTKRPFLMQRSTWIQSPGLSRVGLTKISVPWGKGFHSAWGRRPECDPTLYYIHLHHVDFDLCEQRHMHRASFNKQGGCQVQVGDELRAHMRDKIANPRKYHLTPTLYEIPERVRAVF